MEQIKQIVFTEPNVAEYLTVGEVDFSKIAADQVVVKTAVSTISAGTEKANITGELGTSYKAVFPVKNLGYSSAGEVVAIGEKVKKVQVGDRVVVYWGMHKNYNIVNENNVVKIEYDSLSYEEAAVSFISTFPLAAIRKVNLEIGESLMVMGLGILGQKDVSTSFLISAR